MRQKNLQMLLFLQKLNQRVTTIENITQQLVTFAQNTETHLDSLDENIEGEC